jgi:hypothetical protein
VETTPFTEEQALAGLRGAKAIALADGTLSEAEVALLEAAARALGVTCDVAALLPASGEEVAALLPAGVLRERAVEAAIVLAMIDGVVRPEEVRAIETYARALGVDEPRVANLRQLSAGHVRRMWVDLARRSFAKPIFEEALRRRGLGGVWKIVAPMIGLGKDPDLARRYANLGALPGGTLGHGYFRFIVDNELGFPGEGVVAEEGVWHDLTHVLAGYGTDPEGEVAVVSFIAGYRREDPFFWIFTIALQFHLGIKVSPYSPNLTGHFDTENVLRAMRRGMAMTKDLSVDWDFWPDLALPVETVRAKYGIVACAPRVVG